MGGYVLKRILVTIPTLIGISIIIFLMVRLLPGRHHRHPRAVPTSRRRPEQIAQAREQLGLTGSYPEQYWRWISNFVTGDFGFSYRNTQPVSEILAHAVPITLELVLLGLLIAVVIGLPLGVLSAVKRDSTHDYAGPRRRPHRRQHPELLARDAPPPLHLARVPLGAAADVRRRSTRTRSRT